MGILDAMLDRSLIGYTRLGAALRPLPPIEQRLDGMEVVVTGATSGIGLAAVEGLAALGARVVLVGRSRAKLDDCIERLSSRVGDAHLAAEVADLSSMEQVRELAKRLHERDRPIHRLVNNAGAMFAERQLTDEGIERTLATNLLSHFLLTNLLLPKMKASAPARVINVSSGGMYSVKLDVDALLDPGDDYEDMRAYALTKRAQVVLTEMWAEQLAGSGVSVHAMHPGWADTPGVSSAMPRFYRWTERLLRTPAEGADTILWLCAADEPAGNSGAFWHDRQRRPTHRMARTHASKRERQRLWDELSRLCNS